MLPLETSKAPHWIPGDVWVSFKRACGPEAGLVLFPLQRIGGEPGGDHRIARGEPPHREQEQPAEQDGHPDPGDTDDGTRAAAGGWNDLEIALQPDAGEAHHR